MNLQLVESKSTDTKLINRNKKRISRVFKDSEQHHFVGVSCPSCEESFGLNSKAIYILGSNVRYKCPYCGFEARLED